MASHEYVRSGTPSLTAGILVLLLFFPSLICGCLQVEPEELLPQVIATLPPVTVSTVVPADTLVNNSSVQQPIVITSQKQARIFTDQHFPPEVEKAVSDFTDGKTTDTINGFLRWESIRARTNQSDAARIREQIRSIDYAVLNTTVKENISVYIGISGEQVKRIRNGSVYAEPGYAIGSYDPSVIYYRQKNSGRDSEGYLTMSVIDIKKGSHLLFINATEREFLLPHGGIWDFAREETFENLKFSADSIPRYEEVVMTKVRLIYTKEHP